MTPNTGNVEIPILSWFDRPIKQAIWSVFDDLNKATEALDLFRRYRKNHFARLKTSVKHIKILGMNQPVPLVDVYSPAMVSTTIFSRLYEQNWLSVDSPQPVNPVRRRPVGRETRADEFIEEHPRVAVLGSAGSGKTTLLRHLALSMCDKIVFSQTKLRTSRFPFFVALPSYARATAGQRSLTDYIADELKQYHGRLCSRICKATTEQRPRHSHSRLSRRSATVSSQRRHRPDTDPLRGVPTLPHRGLLPNG